jgi:hypothetical protein
VWQHVRNWSASHGNATVIFLPDGDAQDIHAYQGYLRLWLTEVAIGRNRGERGDQVLAFHGGVVLNFAGAEDTPFTRFSRLDADGAAPVANLNLPVTPLLPFQGGRVEVQAAMFQSPSSGLLAGAAEMADALTEASNAPLSWVTATSARLASGLDSLLERADAEPTLAAHWAGADPESSRMLRPGHLIVVNAPPDQIGRLRIAEGRLRADGVTNSGPTSSADYMVFRLECRHERDDWRFPQLDNLIRAAVNAFLNGQLDSYRANRTEAVVYAWNCADLIPADRVRVAMVVAEEIDAAGRAAELAVSLEASRLSAPDDPGLSQVDLPRLLDGEHLLSGS